MKKIIANWKQNMNEVEIGAWFEQFSTFVEGQEIKVEVIIAPPFPYLAFTNYLMKKLSFISICAQTISSFNDGPHTGDVGAYQVKDYCKYVLVGHSERKDAREEVAKKVKLCLEHNLIPFECFVQSEEISNKNSLDSILIWEDQHNISHDGVYTPKDPKEIETSLADIKTLVLEGREVLYGGSVNSANAQALSDISKLDGVIVGNASLDPKHFFEIVKAFNR